MFSILLTRLHISSSPAVRSSFTVAGGSADSFSRRVDTSALSYNKPLLNRQRVTTIWGAPPFPHQGKTGRRVKPPGGGCFPAAAAASLQHVCSWRSNKPPARQSARGQKTRNWRFSKHQCVKIPPSCRIGGEGKFIRRKIKK